MIYSSVRIRWRICSRRGSMAGVVSLLLVRAEAINPPGRGVTHARRSYHLCVVRSRRCCCLMAGRQEQPISEKRTAPTIWPIQPVSAQPGCPDPIPSTMAMALNLAFVGTTPSNEEKLNVCWYCLALFARLCTKNWWIAMPKWIPPIMAPDMARLTPFSVGH